MSSFRIALAFFTTLSIVVAQPASVISTGAPPNTPAPLFPSVYQDTSRRPNSSGEVYHYDQKPVTTRFVLVTPEQSRQVLDRFKASYSKLKNPRFVIAVNQGVTMGATNRISPNAPVPPATSLADRQTYRDVERMFGRPLRAAGAELVDQSAAVQVLGSQPLSVLFQTNSPQADAKRQALEQIADVVIEVLISPKMVTAPALTGDVTFAIPDLQATATRLRDARVLGQATSADVVTRVPAAALRNFEVREIVEATALVLMEDLSRSAE